MTWIVKRLAGRLKRSSSDNVVRLSDLPIRQRGPSFTAVPPAAVSANNGASRDQGSAGVVGQ